MRFNRSQVQALAFFHTLLGGVAPMLLYTLQHPVAEWVITPIVLVYLETKIWQIVKALGPVEPKLIGKW